MERFKRKRFSVLAVPLQKGVFCISVQFNRKGSGSGFGSWKTAPAVPVPLSVSGKTVPTVPVRFATLLIIGVQETVLLVNHALARGTPAIFVIFVVSQGSSSKALVLLVRMQIRHFRHFRQNRPFSGGTKARFTKSTVFGTPKLLLHPGHLRPVIIKPVGRIFEISDSNPIRGKRGKCGRSLSP